ncbi:MAG TPA: prenyltransferase/squalene oxidase repeat-containing protein [Phycisphaerae bacterium]|nr:prenyltransferase/squalene oxidase repeat-containing protein [Phycisphaerae bacterium]
MVKVSSRTSLAAAIVVLLAPQWLRADEASTALRKYDQPLAKAIDRASAYLARQQQADGSFQANSGMRSAVTSLGLMAFLAKGDTPGTGPYGQVICRGIDYVLATQQPNGLLCESAASRGGMYSHCIGTLLLSEISGMVDPARQKRIDTGLAKALRLILSAQQAPKSAAHKGGWRYQHTSSDSDISCTGWAVMALRSARNNGAAVPKEAIEEAMQFILRCRASDGGFCYQPGGSSGLARTGTALLCLELCGRHGGKEALAAGDRILEWVGQVPAWEKRVQAWESQLRARGLTVDPARKAEQAARMRAAGSQRQFGGSHFYYGVYYCAQGMFQIGGRYWEQYAAYLYEMMLKFQRPDGSWPESGNRAGPCYPAAMSVLALSVSYRQLPIYQR